MGVRISSPVTTNIGSNKNVGWFNYHSGVNNEVKRSVVPDPVKTNSSSLAAVSLQTYEMEILELKHDKKIMQLAFGIVLIVTLLILIVAVTGWILAARRARRYSRLTNYQQKRTVEDSAYMPCRQSFHP